MALQCGIVGLPNVGKSTLFNCLTQSGAAESANYPFCTIEPNVGMVNVPDKRLQALSEIVHPQKIIPAAMQFVDIAGLVKGASEGEGLGNKFLSHVREVDAIAHVVRCFEDENITHVADSVDPARDVELIETELILKDIEAVNKQLDKVARLAKSGNAEAKKAANFYEGLLEVLNSGNLALKFEYDQADEELKKLFDNLYLITCKPIIFVANVAEDGLDANSNPHLKVLEQLAQERNAQVVALCAQTEQELSELEPEEREEFLKDLGLEAAGLDRFIQASYKLLNLATYLTAGETEVRAWTIKQGDKAPQAAGVIHTDFERGFIKADVIWWEDFVKFKGEAGCRAEGAIKLEGKDYVVRDGDVMHFKFNV